jgi:methylenetetrahydrofolate dehydrogenase (NADP+)/methenyltetrahydrofolate cyclohydrolase
MQILTAKELIDRQIPQLKEECASLKTKGITPFLKVFLVGDSAPSLIYTRNKKRFAEKVGAQCEIVHLPKDTSEEQLLNLLTEAANNRLVHGMIVQLPLPNHLAHLTPQIANFIPPHKDVDGFHPLNLFRLLQGDKGDNHLIPCTPKGVVNLMQFYNIPITGQDIVVIGRSMIVGKPLSQLLENYNATLTLCHLHTRDIRKYTLKADTVIIAAGAPRFFTADYFRSDGTQYVIDIGINKDENDKLCGDVDFDRVAPLVRGITPVPGGIGPMTIFSLIQNLLLAAQKGVLG